MSKNVSVDEKAVGAKVLKDQVMVLQAEVNQLRGLEAKVRAAPPPLTFTMSVCRITGRYVHTRIEEGYDREVVISILKEVIERMEALQEVQSDEESDEE